jgi:hypothetical protein
VFVPVEDEDMPSAKIFITDGLEPLTLTIEQTQQVTGESRSQIYARLGRGEYEAVKSGSRTLILFESIKRRIAALPPAKIKPPRPRVRRTP